MQRESNIYFLSDNFSLRSWLPFLFSVTHFSFVTDNITLVFTPYFRDTRNYFLIAGIYLLNLSIQTFITAH
jgi:hypothetical protein